MTKYQDFEYFVQYNMNVEYKVYIKFHLPKFHVHVEHLSSSFLPKDVDVESEEQ